MSMSRVRRALVAATAVFVLAACGTDDGAQVRELEGGGDGSGSASGTGHGSGSGSGSGGSDTGSGGATGSGGE